MLLLLNIQILLLFIFINCFLQMFSITDAQRETHIAISFTELCSINLLSKKKCANVAVTNGLTKNWPREYWVTAEVRIGLAHPRRSKNFDSDSHLSVWAASVVDQINDNVKVDFMPCVHWGGAVLTIVAHSFATAFFFNSMRLTFSSTLPYLHNLTKKLR